MNLLPNSKGFSLMEALVAIVILSVSLLALAGLMTSTTRNNVAGGHLTEAATFAQDTFERLRVSPLTSIPTGVLMQNSCLGATGVLYSGSWIATPDSGMPSTTIRMTVSWVDPAKLQPHSITIISAVSQ